MEAVVYSLIGESAFDNSYILRVGRDKNLTITHPKENRIVAIRHCPAETSIYVREQSDVAYVTPLIFDNRIIEVKPTEKTTLEFLNRHPDNVANGGRVFEKVDYAAEAKVDVELEELILELKTLVREKAKDKSSGKYFLQAHVAAIIGSSVRATMMSMEELKIELYNEIEANPYNFTDEDGNITLFNDPEVSRVFLAMQSIASGVLKQSADQRSFSWSDNNAVVYTTPLGVSKPMLGFATFLGTDEGLLVLDEIKRRLKQ
jgi:hypothetical protein